ncbi:hypothetical protein AVEN_133337-1 [Araneus ventricosus]|uniref:Uncharacterized protein n=1 Tax=Araneus ventricosus TaxID=182803 RepID=A0A4Y2DLK6_ARAVE|nr:hypothetical protein AVEN_133337-1 [Araneus ventricosus]
MQLHHIARLNGQQDRLCKGWAIAVEDHQECVSYHRKIGSGTGCMPRNDKIGQMNIVSCSIIQMAESEYGANNTRSWTPPDK